MLLAAISAIVIGTVQGDGALEEMMQKRRMETLQEATSASSVMQKKNFQAVLKHKTGNHADEQQDSDDGEQQDSDDGENQDSDDAEHQDSEDEDIYLTKKERRTNKVEDVSAS